MRQFVSQHSGRSVKDMMAEPVTVMYLQTCLKPALGERITARNSKEMGILAEVLDLMLTGEVVKAAEMVLQRFKALETFAHEGDWRLAQHLEVSRPAVVSCVSTRELELAKSTMLMEERLHRARPS